MNETFSILIDNKSRPDASDGHGTWLDMPATKEQLHAAMESIGITERNAQDFFISRHADTGEHHFALPYEIIRAASIDELNYLAARLTELDPAELPKLNAALQQKNGAETVAQMIDLTYNLDYYIHAEAQTPRELGDYYLNKSGAVQMPDEWKRGIDLSVFGQNAAESENGVFVPPYGYLSQSGDEWEIHYDGREVPEEYRIMSYPSEQRAAIDYDMPSVAAEVIQSEPIPVKPIILTAEKPAEKLKEITDRLEKGINKRSELKIINSLQSVLCCFLFLLGFYRRGNIKCDWFFLFRSVCCIANPLSFDMPFISALITAILDIISCCGKGLAAVFANRFTASFFCCFQSVELCSAFRTAKQSV